MVKNNILQCIGRSQPEVSVLPLPVRANRAPNSSDVMPQGALFIDDSVKPPAVYVSLGNGLFSSGGNALASTTVAGIVTLTDNTEPVATKAYADALTFAGAPDATTGTKGIVYLATNAEAVANNPPNANTAVTTANLVAKLSAPGAIGNTTPNSGAFSTLSASSTLTVVGASTIAALSATTGAFSSTLTVTDVSTLAALSATTGSFSSTLAVTGSSTIAALSATSGTFSSTLGVTGASTLATVSATSGSFSGAVSVAGLLTLAALTQTGTANINNSGAATTNISSSGTGVVNIGNVTGNVSAVGNLTVTTGFFKIATSGKGLQIKAGAATDFAGNNVLTLGTVTIANSNIATGDYIFLQRIGPAASTALGELTYTISSGVSFTVTSLGVTTGTVLVADVSTFCYFIVRGV